MLDRFRVQLPFLLSDGNLAIATRLTSILSHKEQTPDVLKQEHDLPVTLKNTFGH